MHLTQVAFLALLLAALTAAFGRGGPAERIGGALLLGAALGTPLVQANEFIGLEAGIAIVDFLLLVALLALVFRTDRRWPVFAAGFQAVGVLTHLARYEAGPVHGDVYGHLLVLWSYPVVMALLWGSLVEARNSKPAATVAVDSPRLAAAQTPNALPVDTPRSSVMTNDMSLLVRLLKLHDLGAQSTPLAAQLLARTGSFAAAVATSPARLRQWQFDDRVADALAFARSTTRSSLRRQLETRPSLANGTEVIDYLHSELAHLPHEQFRVLYLNARFRLIHDEIHGEGSVTEAPVFPREIVKRALETGAVHLILAHNHPSGDPEASRADIISTRAIIEATRSIGVTVVDHIVMSSSGHISMRSTGLI